jgi:hypothetical protein
MNINTSAGNESPVTAVVESNNPDTSDLAAVVETLVERVGELEAENERLRDELDDARDEIKTNADRIDDNADEIDATQETVADANHDRARLRADVHELTETLTGTGTGGGDEPTGETTDTDGPDADTPLGDVVTLPETVADTELTANVKRARDVAADVVDYGRSVPAGYAVTASELRTVLTALGDGEGEAYAQTVSRVIGHLDELGGDAVRVKETLDGERTVIFADEFVRRVMAWRNRRTGNGVVTSTEAVGG